MKFLVFTGGCGRVAYELESAPGAAALARYNSESAWGERGGDGAAELADEAPDGLDGPPAPATAEEAAAMLDGRVDPFTGEPA